MAEYEHRQLMAAGIQIFLRQYRYRLDNINFMDLRYRTKLLNIQTDFYENYIDSIVEDISSGKIDLQNLPCDELFRLFSLCAEIARTYGGGFWADYSHTTVQYYPDIAKLFPWVLQNSTNPLDRIWGLIISAWRGDENAKEKLNCLARDIQTTIEKFLSESIIMGIYWFGDNGTTFALFCYASGNPGLGIIIDKIVLCCDIAKIIIDYKRSKDNEKLLKDILTVVSSILIGKVAKETTEVIINSLKRDITKKIPEYINQLVPIIEDLAGSIVS